MVTERMEGWSPDPASSIPPEDQAKIRLTKWFESYGAEVYWEKEVPHGRETFSSRATAEKPDLLVEHPDWPTIAYEVKIGDDGTAIYDGAVQTVRYWREFEQGHEEYRVRDTVRTPSVFALATGNAKLGRLYDDGFIKERCKVGQFMSSGRKRAISLNQVPRHEYSSSETTLRLMWRFMDQYAADDGITPKTGVGVLYSDVLDNDPEEFDDDGSSSNPGICYKKSGSSPQWRILQNQAQV